MMVKVFEKLLPYLIPYAGSPITSIFSAEAGGDGIKGVSEESNGGDSAWPPDSDPELIVWTFGWDLTGGVGVDTLGVFFPSCAVWPPDEELRWDRIVFKLAAIDDPPEELEEELGDNPPDEVGEEAIKPLSETAAMSFSSPVTGSVAPIHHTPWAEAMDDSLKTFLNK